MDTDVLFITGFGVLVLLTAWLPLALKALPLSLPIFCVAVGAALATVPAFGRAVPRAHEHLSLIEHVTGLVVLLSLIGAGLKIDRRFGLRRWAMTWRMLCIAMPLTILGLAALAFGWLGLGVPAALLLGASLAPTDPVLAADVQVEGPSKGDGDEVRFTLTTEASLNDGMAFPFVTLAMMAAAAGGIGGVPLAQWFVVDVLWKTISGAILGIVVGGSLGWVAFHMPAPAKLLSKTGDGFVALGVTFLAYGIVEIAHGYGFIGVFAAALAFRASCPEDEYHERMYRFAEEVERLLMMVVLVGFGAALVEGSLLAGLTWSAAGFALVALVIVRPLCGWIATVGSGLRRHERLIVGFFGIRGLATLFYLAYAFQRAEIERHELMWAVASSTILVSIVMHGVLVTPALAFLDRRAERRAA